MMNPTYHFNRMHDLLNEFQPSRERSLAATKLDEAQMWLARCEPTREALQRDQAAISATEQVAKGLDYIDMGKVAYEAYCAQVNWTSVRGEHLSDFENQNPAIQHAWRIAGEAVMQTYDPERAIWRY